MFKVVLLSTILLFSNFAIAMEQPPLGTKPILNFTPDGSGYWWVNPVNYPAYCTVYYPNGMTYNFWLAPFYNSIMFPSYLRSDCNYY